MSFLNRPMRWLFLVVLCLTAVVCPAQQAGMTSPPVVPSQPAVVGPALDMVLVFEDTRSLRESGIAIELNGALNALLAQAGTAVAMAVIGYDDTGVRVITPLTQVPDIDISPIATVLSDPRDGISAGSSDAALERAIYELRYLGTAPENRIVLLRGAPAIQADATDVPGVDLASYLSTEGSGLLLVASATAAAAGLPDLGAHDNVETVYLADGNSLSGLFSRLLSGVISGPVAAPQSEAELPEFIPVTGPEPAVSTPAVPVPSAGGQERLRSLIILVAGVILAVTLIALILLLVKRGRDYRKQQSGNDIEAYLLDPRGFTGQSRYLLGRKATMLGRVAGKDSAYMDYIVIPEPTIGRRHAVIEYKDYGYWIMDQGSINGTFVNDMPVNSEIRLKHGDTIRLHKFEFGFVIPEHDQASTTWISETVLAGHVAGAAAVAAAEPGPEVDALRSEIASDDFVLDLDFSAAESPAVSAETAADDETLLPMHGMNAPAGSDEADVTLMPDFSASPVPPTTDQRDDIPGYRSDHDDASDEDVTLMPADGMEDYSHAPLRPDNNDDDDEIFDVTGSDGKDR